MYHGRVSIQTSYCLHTDSRFQGNSFGIFSACSPLQSGENLGGKHRKAPKNKESPLSFHGDSMETLPEAHCPESKHRQSAILCLSAQLQVGTETSVVFQLFKLADGFAFYLANPFTGQAHAPGNFFHRHRINPFPKMLFPIKRRFGFKQSFFTCFIYH